MQKVITIGVMSRVEKWLSQNQKTMAKVKHGDVNPSYKSKNMILHIDRVQGKVMQYSVNHLSSTESKESIYDTDEEDKIQFLESSMTIDIPKQLVILKRENDRGEQKFSFESVIDIQESPFTVSELELNSKNIDSEFGQHFFKLKLEKKNIKLFSPGSVEDRN